MSSTQMPRAALITGAGRRIGATIAFALSRAGYAVVLHANQSRAQAEKLAGEIMCSGGHASVVLADLADGRRIAVPVDVLDEVVPDLLLTGREHARLLFGRWARSNVCSREE